MAKRSALPSGDQPLSASRTLIERAYEQLRDDIVDGHLPPDEKLRVEHLKARYGVSAGTLREAITRLVSDALVITEGQRGFRVAPIAVAAPRPRQVMGSAEHRLSRGAAGRPRFALDAAPAAHPGTAERTLPPLRHQPAGEPT